MPDVLVPVLFDDAGQGPSGATMQYVGAAITNTRRLPTSQETFNVADYGAVGVAPGVVATVDETAALNACIADAAAVRGTVLFGNRGYKVSTLNIKSGVTYQGVGSDFGSTNKGTTIWGTVGLNCFEFPNAANTGSTNFFDLTIRSGLNAIATPVGTTGTSNLIRIDRCLLNGSNAGVYNDYYIDTWRMSDCLLVGGLYGFQLAPSTGGVFSQMDKSTFMNVYVSGATKNCWRIEADSGGYSNTWINPVCIGAQQDAFYVDGSFVGGTVINANFEANGKTGKNHRTTLSGAVGSGATSGTLASLTTGGSSAQTTGLLSGSISSSGAITTITLQAATNILWYQSGTVLIDSEAFHYTGLLGSTLTGVTRAVQGTSMAAHSNGASVKQIWSDNTHPNAGDGNTNVLTIRGAGASGKHHKVTITTLDVPTRVVNWTGATATTVTDPEVTNAVYSEFKFAGSITGSSGWVFVGGLLGGEGTGGRLQYCVDASFLRLSTFLNTGGNAGLLASLYDPTYNNFYFGAQARMTWDRYAGGFGGGNWNGTAEVFTKAGVVADVDFGADYVPVSGTLALDTTNNKLMVRVGSTWKGVTVA